MIPASAAGRPRSRLTPDVSVGVHKFNLAIEAVPEAAEAAVRPMGEVFVDVLEMVSPRDTRRFIRAYQQAANMAGLTQRPLVEIKHSSNRAEYLAALEKQVRFWENRAAHFDRFIARADAEDNAKGPLTETGKPRRRRSQQTWYRKYTRERDKAVREVKKSLETLAEAEGAEGFLLFDRGGYIRGKPKYGKTGKRRRTSIRTKVYGGEGWIETLGGVSLVHFVNKEPHARLVAFNSRHGKPLDLALAAVKTVGGTRVRSATAHAIARASGLERGKPLPGPIVGTRDDVFALGAANRI